MVDNSAVGKWITFHFAGSYPPRENYYINDIKSLIHWVQKPLSTGGGKLVFRWITGG
jgi:hypothetical protein